MKIGDSVATYLYCVTTGAPVPGPAVERMPNGIGGAVVRPVAASGLAAWVSDVGDARVPPTAERARAHDAVCDAVLGTGTTPLPMRFGQTFRNDAELVVALGDRRDVLASRLARIAGCVEMRVVVAADLSSRNEPSEAPAEPGPGPGTAHLRQLARSRRSEVAHVAACEQMRASLCQAASSLVVEDTGCLSGRGIVYVAQLVRRADVGRYRAAFADVATRSTADLTLLGPFAPYSFTGDA